MDNLAYCNLLFDETTDGYIQIIQLNNGSAIKIYNTNNTALREIVEEIKGENDYYITPNTFYKPKRSTSYIRQYRSLYIDIDVDRFGKYGKAETVYAIYDDLIYQDKIPEPSMIIDSGRGIHLYWKIDNAPYGAIQTWQELEDYLYSNLKSFGADIKATDGARVLRLPNTINSRNNAECKVLVINEDIKYSMYSLREKYLNYKPKNYQLEIQQTKEINKNKKCVVNNFFNSYTLHLGRIQDIETLCKLRQYDVKGYRNFIIHIYAYWSGIYTRDTQALEKMVLDLNNSFKQPLKESEIKAVLRCVPKAIDKFIQYEQGVRSGQVKRVTKGMKDKGGYWYKNQTLIESLDITLSEQKHMKTIIGTEEKYRRKNIKRTESRRNAEGLTQREQQKKERIQEIMRLKKLGLNQSKIAKELNISRQAVSKILKSI